VQNSNSLELAHQSLVLQNAQDKNDWTGQGECHHQMILGPCLNVVISLIREKSGCNTTLALLQAFSTASDWTTKHVSDAEYACLSHLCLGVVWQDMNLQILVRATWWFVIPADPNGNPLDTPTKPYPRAITSLIRQLVFYLFMPFSLQESRPVLDLSDSTLMRKAGRHG
jgi:hypothetical protein